MKYQTKFSVGLFALTWVNFRFKKCSYQITRLISWTCIKYNKRIGKILKICVPTPWCQEARLIYLQSILLVFRTLLTDLSTRIEGGVGRYIIAKDTAKLQELLAKFLLFAIPGSYINAALKYLQTRIKLAFMHRLTHHLHHSYFSHRAYYAASWLGGLTSAESRLSADVEKFAFAIS